MNENFIRKAVLSFPMKPPQRRKMETNASTWIIRVICGLLDVSADSQQLTQNDKLLPFNGTIY